MPKTNYKTYHLCLINRQLWTITAVPEAADWLEKFADIVKIKPAKKDSGKRTAKTSENRIIVMKNPQLSAAVPLKYLPADIAHLLPKAGWKNHDIKHCQIWSHPKSKAAIFEFDDNKTLAITIIRMWTLLDIIYRQVIACGGFPIHSALVRKGQKGVIIAAHGGTGKSTCCRRIPPPWKGVCDDEVLVVCDKSGRYFAHPCPTWSNFLLKRRKRPAWPIEKAVPISAYCFLKQSKKDRIEFVGRGQAAVSINQFSSQIAQRSYRNISKEQEVILRRKIFENACKAANFAQSYILEAHKNGKFWDEIERIL